MKCVYFKKCGGCSLQNMDYNKQLESKKTILRQITGINDIKVYSGKEFNYRNRLDLIFHENGIGFRKRKTWNEIVDIKECIIAEKRLNVLIDEIRKEFVGVDAFDINTKKGTYKFVVVRTPSNDSSISFVLNSESKKINDAIDKIKQFAKKSSANNIIVSLLEPERDTTISDNFQVIKGNDFLKENIMNNEFVFSVQGFFQNNTEMAKKMHKYCHELIKKYNLKNACLLDLYGGVGTFGIINSKYFKNVIIAESVKPAIDCAKKNIDKNNVNNVVAENLDAKYIRKLSLKNPLIVLTDPPRGGMHPRTIMELNKIKPDLIIYVSCNPQQLEKELGMLRNHTIKSVALFDLFPQTEHCETIVELILKK